MRGINWKISSILFFALLATPQPTIVSRCPPSPARGEGRELLKMPGMTAEICDGMGNAIIISAILQYDKYPKFIANQSP
jgi:hypothetical protein